MAARRYEPIAFGPGASTFILSPKCCTKGDAVEALHVEGLRPVTLTHLALLAAFVGSRVQASGSAATLDREYPVREFGNSLLLLLGAARSAAR
jgi:hypothetical protein